jgi:hypothetical protein
MNAEMDHHLQIRRGMRFRKVKEFIEADRIREESGCVLRYDRTFMRPSIPNGTKHRQLSEPPTVRS